jgi:SPP1 family phage portal protein
LTTDEIKKLIDLDRNSKKKAHARQGQKYYEGRHDILNYRMFYFNNDGQLTEDTYRSNVKIPHPFFTELVDQAVQYIMSGEKFAYSENADLQSKLDEYFNNNEDFTASLSELLTNCTSKGFGYMFAYKNEDDILCFQSADTLNVVEVKPSDTEDNREYVIYYYDEYNSKRDKSTRHIRVWDDQTVSFYVQQENSEVVFEKSQPHNLYSRGKKVFSKNFGFIPFFRLDNNKKQVSDLALVKELIDDYDLMASSLSNNLIDFDMPLYAIKGYESTDLDELQTNLKTKKIIGLDDEGGVDVKTVDVPYQARQIKLELDEKNIYRFGMGLNINGLKDTSATTNIAIKAAYSLLDLKCSKLEIRLKQFLRSIAKPVLEEINEKENTGYKLSDIRFEFKHEIMSNALENSQIEQNKANAKQTEINILLSLADDFDDETRIRKICEVLDVEYDEVKDRLPKSATEDIANAEAALDVQAEVEETTGKALNGAQTASLLSIIAQYKAKTLTADEAVSIISISIGISEERARKLLHIGV